MVISDRPKVLFERMNSRPGVPLSSRSSGTVMRCSTSSAAMPGACVMTWELVSAMSG